LLLNWVAVKELTLGPGRVESKFLWFMVMF
jgi:hypothetical protein